MRSRVAVGAFTIVLAVGGAARSQSQPPAQPQVRTAPQQYKNIKVLTDLPANQMNETMHLIQGSLGVECQFCHIWGEWERDDKPMKAVARRMLAMMSNINKTSFGGAQMVTCYTCHRGSPTPVSMVVLPVPRPPSVDNPPPPPSLPSVDAILTKYIDAIGGEKAVRKATSRVIVGKRDIPTGSGGMTPMDADAEIYQKAPNLVLSVYRTPMFTVSDGFDGTVGWTKNAQGRVSSAFDQGRVKRGADFYQPLDLKQEYTQMTVRGIEKVHARDAYVVVGLPMDDTPERLYFDVQTGLLVRRATFIPTGVGNSPYEVDYQDYRTTKSGMKIPFVIQMNPSGQHLEVPTSSTLRVEKVQEDIAIDDAKFTRPQ